MSLDSILKRVDKINSEEELVEILSKKFNNNLDLIHYEKGIADFLEVPRKTDDILRALVQQGYINPENYDGRLVRTGSKRQMSRLLRPEIVGRDISIENYRKHITLNSSEYTNLDNLPNHNQLLAFASELSGENISNKSDLAKVFVQYGVLSGELQEGQSIFKPGSQSSFYINKDIVGDELAEANFIKFISENYSSLDEISQSKTLSIFLGVTNSKGAIQEAINEMGIFPESFRSYASTNIPEQFRRKGKPKPASKRNNSSKEISETFQGKKSAVFDKGEAFEQVVGLYLSYTNPEELIIPQYCLNVTDNHFGTRVDFKVGEKFVEVKWGNAKENIEETHQKHTSLTDKLYEVVRLEDQVQVGVETAKFEDLYKGAEISSSLDHISNILLENQNDSKLMIAIRDYFYGVVEDANHKNGEERKEYISQKLQELKEVKREELSNYLKENTRSTFQTLEAHFEHEGELYRAFISPSQLAREESEKYEATYNFGDLGFKNELDRNLAVLLEYAKEGVRVEDMVEDVDELIHPLFIMPNSRRVSTNGHEDATKIESLEQAVDILALSQEAYSDTMEYVGYHGVNC
ncbi:hypothetical protein C0585_08305 [Candidatus Woesearchaeota archaeon]|nr:MAG: hypothetical protein C0585_08305 [Candidatus Woesearchaeota archaeon]